jgi:hypothetical protein
MTMKITVTPLQTATYSIEGLTAKEAAAVALLLGRAKGDISSATYSIYCQLTDVLEKGGVDWYDMFPNVK